MGALQSDAEVTLSCRYGGLNYLFSYVHGSTDYQCFSKGQTTPKIAPSRGRSQPHLIRCSWAHQTKSRSVQLFFAQHIRVTSTQTDSHTDHATCDTCSNRPQLMHRVHAMWPNDGHSVSTTAIQCTWVAYIIMIRTLNITSSADFYWLLPVLFNWTCFPQLPHDGTSLAGLFICRMISLSLNRQHQSNE